MLSIRALHVQHVYLYVLAASLNQKKELEYSANTLPWKKLLDRVRIPGAEYVTLKLYPEPVLRVPIDSYRILLEQLTVDNPRRMIETIPEYVLYVLKPRAWPKIALTTTLPLMPFQKEGVEFIISRKGRGIIADGMGLGKTIQGVALLEFYRDSRPALILCPAAVKGNWKSHIVRYLGEEPVVIHNGKQTFDRRRINIMSYNLSISEAVDKTFAPSFLLLDESHYVKNMSSKRTKQAFNWSQRAKHVVLLTGTPMDRASELYAQIKCVRPQLFPKFFHYQFNMYMSGMETNLRAAPREFYYASRYCRPEVKYTKGQRTLTFKGSENEMELHAILREHVMIRRTKEEVLQDLPEKTREMVVIDEWMQDKPMQFSTDAKFMECVRETALRKIPQVKKYVSEILLEELTNNPHLKVLCWGYYHGMIDALHETLDGCGIENAVMDGRTPQSKREESIQEFQRPGSTLRVAVLGLGSMNSGITLTAASLSIVAELGMSPVIHYQAEDRCHRIGQKVPVTIRYLLCEGSTDDIVWKLLDKKTSASGLVIDNAVKTFEPEIVKRRKIDHGQQSFDDLLEKM